MSLRSIRKEEDSDGPVVEIRAEQAMVAETDREGVRTSVKVPVQPINDDGILSVTLFY